MDDPGHVHCDDTAEQKGRTGELCLKALNGLGFKGLGFRVYGFGF